MSSGLPAIPTVVVYDDMGHLCYGGAPEWFDLTLAIGEPPYKWLYRHPVMSASGYVCVVNRRTCEDPLYRLNTPHGSVMLDLTGLLYEPRKSS